MSRNRAIQLTFATLAIAFFATPIAARILGITAESFENRKLADPPKLSQGWNAFPQTTQYLTDRMPLRKQAVEANTRIWTDVFKTDPAYNRDDTLASDQALPFAGGLGEARAPEVRQDNVDLRAPATASTGRRGWLYVPIEFEIACDHSVPDARLLRRWANLISTVRSTGRESSLFVVPHKASVYPEHLPAEYEYDHCALRAKERLWHLLAEQGGPLGVRELRSDLMRLKPHAGDGLFQRSDMHWSTLGALTLVDAVLETFGDGIELGAKEIVARGSVSYTGDLSVVGGNARQDTRDEYRIERDPNAERVPGRTLILCDSFAYKWFKLFKPYFDNVRYVTWYTPVESIVKEIGEAERVIVEADEILLKAQAKDGEKVAQIVRALRENGA